VTKTFMASYNSAKAQKRGSKIFYQFRFCASGPAGKTAHSA
jgi:hypothetical protein